MPNRVSIPRRFSIFDDHNSTSRLKNCQTMFCGGGHFNKQERILSKIAKEKYQNNAISDQFPESMN